MQGEPQLSPLYLSVHDQKFIAPSGGATIVLNQTDQKATTFTAVNVATNEPLFDFQRGNTTLAKFEDATTKKTLCKVEVQAFGTKKNIVDASKNLMYQLHDEVMDDQYALLTTVTNALDGLQYEVALRVRHAHGELYSILDGEKRLVAITERVLDQPTNKFTYNLKIAEGMDVLLVAVLLVASKGGVSKATQIGVNVIGSVFLFVR
ncbi:hypothetical protein BJ742DRAFT_768624 [Cladochytrium replicatum]|nr:hypothetical protein BJ742DRAFT_768624 [Cladochytrium replicatum]